MTSKISKGSHTSGRSCVSAVTRVVNSSRIFLSSRLPREAQITCIKRFSLACRPNRLHVPKNVIKTHAVVKCERSRVMFLVSCCTTGIFHRSSCNTVILPFSTKAKARCITINFGINNVGANNRRDHSTRYVSAIIKTVGNFLSYTENNGSC